MAQYKIISTELTEFKIYTLVVHKNNMSQDNMIKFECTECHAINYYSRKNKKLIKDRLELKKFCKNCKKHILHKETK